MFSYFFLFIIIIIGFITSYTDIYFFKIRNKVILAGLFISIFTYLFLFLFGFLNFNSILIIFNDFIYVFILSIFLWLIKSWATGDAKLYMIFSLLTPFTIYNGVVHSFYSINILINALFLLFLKLFLEIIFNLHKLSFKKFYKKIDLYKNLFLILFLLFIQNLLIFFNIFFNNPTNNFIFLLFLLFISQFFISYFKIKLNIISIYFLFFLIVFSIILMIGNIMSFIIIFLKTIIFYLLFSIIFIILPELSFSKKVKIKDLKEGMIIDETIYLINSKYYINLVEKKDLIYDKKFEKELSGIDSNLINKLKLALKNNNLIFKELTILEYTYFAPYLFFGTLVVYIIKDNIIC